MIQNDTEATGAMTVQEFLQWARISRTTFYAEVGKGRIQIQKLGKKTLIRRREAERWLNSLPAAA